MCLNVTDIDIIQKIDGKIHFYTCCNKFAFKKDILLKYTKMIFKTIWKTKKKKKMDISIELDQHETNQEKTR